jgi:mono/diheme cytochrome c family protein
MRYFRSLAMGGAVLAWWVVAGMAGAAGGDPVKGKAVYEQRCLACHGPQGRGDGPTGKVLVPPAADFTSAASKKKSDAELLKIIENGKPPSAMIAWKGQLSDQDIQHVLAYVKTLRK